MEHTSLHPGEYKFTSRAEKHIISTILGSCVSVCLFDTEAGIIGMNHILLANPRYARSMPIVLSEAGRYGVHAMELLINGMMQLGADRKRLQAKTFGGANVLRGIGAASNFAIIGDINSRFITEFLTNERIPILSSDLGGDRGRFIFFDGRDYSVYTRKITATKTQEIEVEEKTIWTDRIDHRKEEATPEPDLW